MNKVDGWAFDYYKGKVVSMQAFELFKDSWLVYPTLSRFYESKEAARQEGLQYLRDKAQELDEKFLQVTKLLAALEDECLG